MAEGSVNWNCEHKWLEVIGTRTDTGANYKCEACGGLMAIGSGKIEPGLTFEERVIAIVVADLKANGKIRNAVVGVY